MLQTGVIIPAGWTKKKKNTLSSKFGIMFFFFSLAYVDNRRRISIRVFSRIIFKSAQYCENYTDDSGPGSKYYIYLRGMTIVINVCCTTLVSVSWKNPGKVLEKSLEKSLLKGPEKYLN